jgi:thiamine biosynthesis lipoprotein
METNSAEMLFHVSRPAMAGEFEVCFPAARYPHGTVVAVDALDAVEEVERQLSFFRPDSDIHRINESAAERPVEVEPRLFALLQSAIQLCEETGGAYDITATPLWEAWGFAERAGRVPSDAQLAEARACVGRQWIELDALQRTIRFCKPGVRISLGSVGKGYALDRCGERLLAEGMEECLLHGDQSSVLAQGRVWEIGIRNPENPEQRLGTLRLRNQALGTSGVQFQSFEHEGRRFGHLFDPRTGMPVEGILSTTVIAPTAALADMLSTALFVMGPEKAADYCRTHADIGMVMLIPARSDGGIEIRLAGIAEAAWTVAAP